jgi:hypothetical protein
LNHKKIRKRTVGKTPKKNTTLRKETIMNKLHFGEDNSDTGGEDDYTPLE